MQVQVQSQDDILQTPHAYDASASGTCAGQQPGQQCGPDAHLPGSGRRGRRDEPHGGARPRAQPAVQFQPQGAEAAAERGLLRPGARAPAEEPVQCVPGPWLNACCCVYAH